MGPGPLPLTPVYVDWPDGPADQLVSGGFARVLRAAAVGDAIAPPFVLGRAPAPLVVVGALDLVDRDGVPTLKVHLQHLSPPVEDLDG